MNCSRLFIVVLVGMLGLAKMPQAAERTLEGSLLAWEKKIEYEIKRDFPDGGFSTLGTHGRGEGRIVEMMRLERNLDWVMSAYLVTRGVINERNRVTAGVKIDEVKARLLKHLNKPVLRALLYDYKRYGLKEEFYGHPLPETNVIESIRSILRNCDSPLE